ncbi:MAG: right-handed parallel beta-helix repeat-containing protein [bacterium]|nr:right-handed parallel beta-helix repeat-containing protein [bacterium]
MKKAILILLLSTTVFIWLGCSKDEDNKQNVGTGAITGNWYGNQSGTFTVAGELIVPAGQILTLAPGTVLSFERFASMHIYGKLIAIGTKDNPIIFTSSSTIPDRGHWEGVVFHPNPDTSVIKWAQFRWGGRFDLSTDTISTPGGVFKGLISVDSTNLMISNSIITMAGWDGIEVQNSGYANITNCTFFKNAFNAVSVRLGGRIELYNNIISSNDDAAFRIRRPGGGTFTGGYTCVWDNNTNPPYINELGAPFEQLPGDFVLDPLMFDPMNFDFRIRAGSGAIDKGNPASPLDPDNTRADCGAFYYHQSPNELFGPQKGNLAAGTYLVKYDIWVERGDTLTIAPGTTIKFDGGYSLVVHGKLFASGTPENPIRFTSAKLIPARGDWKNIYFDGTATSNSELKHVIVEYAGILIPNSSIANGAISINNSNMILEDVQIKNALFVGLHLSSGAGGSIQRLEINGFGMYGIHCELNVTTDIQKIKILNGLGTGLRIENNSTPTITNALIVSNNVSGIEIERLARPVLSFLTVAHNVYHGISISSNSTVTLTNSIIASNGLHALETMISSQINHTHNMYWRSPNNNAHLLVNIENTRVRDIDLDPTEQVADPQFIGGNPFNYRLSSSSPARNAASNGTDLGAYGGSGLF